jgi:hypothetical protein
VELGSGVGGGVGDTLASRMQKNKKIEKKKREMIIQRYLGDNVFTRR